MPRHGDLGAIRENIFGNFFKAFDETENVIPPAAVEPGSMIPQFVKDFIHLKSRQDRLDQNGRFDVSRGRPSCSWDWRKMSFQRRPSR